MPLSARIRKINCWDSLYISDNSIYLLDTGLTAQHHYKAILQYFEIAFNQIRNHFVYPLSRIGQNQKKGNRIFVKNTNAF